MRNHFIATLYFLKGGGKCSGCGESHNQDGKWFARDGNHSPDNNFRVRDENCSRDCNCRGHDESRNQDSSFHVRGDNMVDTRSFPP